MEKAKSVNKNMKNNAFLQDDVQPNIQNKGTELEQKKDIYHHLVHSNVPSRNHWFLYSLTVLMSLFVLVLILVLAILASNFSSFQIGAYVIIAAVSFSIGAITGIILNKLVQDERRILSGSLSISILGVFCISILIFMLNKLSAQMEEFALASDGSSLGIISMFGPSLNPYLAGIILVMTFNVFPYIIFKKRSKSINN